MSVSLIVHILNEEPILCEVDEMPDQADQFVILNNPRRRDGNDLTYLEDEVTVIMIPWHRINFIEVISTAESEEVITIVREQ